MNRIERKFQELKKNKKKAFIAFITAGYPDLATTVALIREFDKIGVDIVELGVPFTDPMADGPVIQEASQYALKHGVRLLDILRSVKKVRAQVSLPICVMTYYNPIFCFGEERFAREAVLAGIDGIIIPDLPMEESFSFQRHARKAGLDLIQFIAPTTSPQRAKKIAQAAQGFIYYVSLTGTTGARMSLPKDITGSLRMIKRYTDKPVCAGFGISTAEQVCKISRACDGVIVGSAIVKSITQSLGKKNLVDNVSSLVRSLQGKE